MKYLTRTTRRIIATASMTGLIAAAAFATTPSGTALAAGTTRAAAASIPACTAAGLGVWVAIEQGNGAAGTIYYPLQFTNLSGHTCSLYGFPGVSAISRNGHQLGSPAGWGARNPIHTVILVPGATAHAILAYHNAVVTTEPGCDPVYSTFGLRVYPPNQYTATYAAFGLEACSHAAPVYMNVGPILPEAGTING